VNVQAAFCVSTLLKRAFSDGLIGADKGNGHGVLSSGKTKRGIIKKENKSGKAAV